MLARENNDAVTQAARPAPRAADLHASRLAERDESLARLHALAEEQAALRRVATLVAGDADPPQVFAKVCAEVGALLGVDSTNLVRFETADTAKVVGGWGRHGAPVFPAGADVPLDGDTAVVKVSRSGRPERVDDYTGLDGELSERLRSLGIASAVAAPIKVAGRLWGAVVASSGRPYDFPPDTEERIAGFAELVADALANADAREQLAASRARIVEAGDAERRRLERNLHDGAQQRLVNLALRLREVEANLDSDPDAARRGLASARDELGLALEELRELARGIHPAILSDRGLGPALDALVARAPVAVRITELPTTRLPEPVEAAAYYLVAEALTNVSKHARATEATVRVGRTGDRVRIEVRDDGVGGAALRDGSGLRGLADRVEALGGRLRVDSPPGGGTTLIGDIPLA
jgi:signal transduction histidine kinase